MNHVGLEKFFKSHLRYKQHWNKKHIDMRDAQWQSLSEDTWLNGMSYAAGSQFKVFETTNFGWIVFAPGTLTAEGNIPHRRIIKW